MADCWTKELDGDSDSHDEVLIFRIEEEVVVVVEEETKGSQKYSRVYIERGSKM